MLVSYDLLYELEAVLMRPKFREKLTFSDVQEYVRYIADRATMVEQPEPHRRVAGIPDPDDHYLANLAGQAQVDRLVSGDSHLHATSPREFLEELDPQAR
jgi:putative PIN family toxin of toxin-antitoxin system